MRGLWKQHKKAQGRSRKKPKGLIETKRFQVTLKQNVTKDAIKLYFNEAMQLSLPATLGAKDSQQWMRKVAFVY